MNIATRIEIAMRVAGIKSQADLSRLSGVSETSISRIMKGETLPSLENAAALAKSLNVSIDWLVNGEDQKNNDVTEFPLVHVNQKELRLLTQLRQAPPEGRELIFAAAAAAEQLSSPQPDVDDLPEPDKDQ